MVRKTPPSKRLDELSVRRVWGDVMDLESLATAMQGQDVVFHLAGCAKAVQANRSYESTSKTPVIRFDRALDLARGQFGRLLGGWLGPRDSTNMGQGLRFVQA